MLSIPNTSPQAGEVFTLPVVVLISLMAQPRLQLAMAQDGLLPPIFSQVDEHGNLKWGTFLSGVAMVVTATFVPFAYLDDLISVGILVAFSMTDSCLILLRCESPMQKPRLVEKHLVAYNGFCLLTGLLCSHASRTAMGALLSAISLIITICIAISLAAKCPQSVKFGGSILSSSNAGGNLSAITDPTGAGEYFRTPFVPYLPCSGIFINWFLVSQLEISGLLLLFVYIGMALTAYFCCCTNSSISNSLGWKRGSYEALPGLEQGSDDLWPSLKREFSLPPFAHSSASAAANVTTNANTIAAANTEGNLQVTSGTLT